MIQDSLIDVFSFLYRMWNFIPIQRQTSQQLAYKLFVAEFVVVLFKLACYSLKPYVHFLNALIFLHPKLLILIQQAIYCCPLNAFIIITNEAKSSSCRINIRRLISP